LLFARFGKTAGAPSPHNRLILKVIVYHVYIIIAIVIVHASYFRGNDVQLLEEELVAVIV
jgi:hypothetical protein